MNIQEIIDDCLIEYPPHSGQRAAVQGKNGNTRGRPSYSIDLQLLDIRIDFFGAWICFTGFSAAEQESLAGLAPRANFCKAKTVGKKVKYLVCGNNAGPAKISKASEQGVRVLGIEDFFKLLAGELKK